MCPLHLWISHDNSRRGTHKGLISTIAGVISVASPYFITTPILHTIQCKSDLAIISGPSILVDEILCSHNALNISEHYPSNPRQAELPLYIPHLRLASIIQSLQTQTWILGLPTLQNIITILSISIHPLPMAKHIHFSETP